jgi:molybdopterin synthase sulfur carrier subunit
MQVNFFATFRTVVRQKTVQFDLPENSSAFQLLQAIIKAYPALQPRLLDENDQLLKYVHLFVNGRDIQLLPMNLQTPLLPDDKVDIFPPVAGGTSK